MLSTSVANALELFHGPDNQATVEFVRVFDKFFDCLNVRNKREWIVKRKGDLKPYETVDDPRLEVYGMFRVPAISSANIERC